MCLSDISLFHKWHEYMNIVNGTHLTIIHGISVPTLLHYGRVSHSGQGHLNLWHAVVHVN